jgi:Asp-tRNA(Asn)/Glu-tRNA(Gln) amidotransferase A subunit family amidase
MADDKMADSVPTLLNAIFDIQNGAIPANEVLALASARAALLEPWLKAFSYLPERHPSPNEVQGLLAGIPVGVKDIIATHDMPTTNGSPIYAGHMPAEDAEIVRQLKELGGIVFGKTVTTEFAWRHPGPTVNPWNPLHSPGGSSSGSAASVAAGIVPLAFGSQTLGSIIRPAAYNGVVGFKASFGAVPREGVHPFAGSLDHIGFFARKVEDVAAAFAIFVEHLTAPFASRAAWDSHFQKARAPRLAVIRTGNWGHADAEQQRNFEASLVALQRAGGELVGMDLSADTKEVIDATLQMARYEGAANFGGLVEQYPSLCSSELKQLVIDGNAVPENAYRATLALQARLRQELSEWIAPCDAVVTIPATGEAPFGIDYTGDAAFCMPWTFMGVPAVTIPSGWSANGLPLGLQIVASFGRDKKTLQIAAWAEEVLNWQPRRIE